MHQRPNLGVEFCQTFYPVAANESPGPGDENRLAFKVFHALLAISYQLPRPPSKANSFSRLAPRRVFYFAGQGLLFCERELLEFMLQHVCGPEQPEG